MSIDNRHILLTLLASFLITMNALAAPDGVRKSAVDAKFARKVRVADSSALLWQEPTNIRSRNLFFGSGGKDHEPQGPFTFVKEDPDGTNPKFVVRDRKGVNWKVKLGKEARPETVASRLLWAAGYFTPDDYFLASLPLPGKVRLQRGAGLQRKDGSFANARLKRDGDEKKLGVWKWKNNNLREREYNGLRVMMALVNNWDLKDVNNAVYEDGGRKVHLVSDLGASFGTSGLSWTKAMSRDNLTAYSRSKFITKATPEYVNFGAPSRPALINVFALPNFIMRFGLVELGKHIPREDVVWMGQTLAKLSPGQIRDAFRAGGYSLSETEAFARVIEQRIAALNQL